MLFIHSSVSYDTVIPSFLNIFLVRPDRPDVLMLQYCAGTTSTHLMNLSVKPVTYLSMNFYALALVLVFVLLQWLRMRGL